MDACTLREGTQQRLDAYSIAGSITLTNQSGNDLYIWSVNSVGTAADLEEDLIFPAQSTTVQVADCLRINLVAETSGDETQLLKSTYTWRWSLAMLGRTGKDLPPTDHLLTLTSHGGPPRGLLDQRRGPRQSASVVRPGPR